MRLDLRRPLSDPVLDQLRTMTPPEISAWVFANANAKDPAAATAHLIRLTQAVVHLLRYTPTRQG